MGAWARADHRPLYWLDRQEALLHPALLKDDHAYNFEEGADEEEVESSGLGRPPSSRHIDLATALASQAPGPATATATALATAAATATAMPPSTRDWAQPGRRCSASPPRGTPCSSPTPRLKTASEHLFVLPQTKTIFFTTHSLSCMFAAVVWVPRQFSSPLVSPFPVSMQPFVASVSVTGEGLATQSCTSLSKTHTTSGWSSVREMLVVVERDEKD